VSACWLGSRNSVVLTLVMLVVANDLVLPRIAHAGDKVARIGFVGAESSQTTVRAFVAFREHLGELGWIEGKNLVIEQRWAGGRSDRLPGLMAEVIGSKVDVLVTYSTPGAIAARDATNTVPIVVASMGEPVASGVADSLARPGRNLTGLSMAWGEGIPGKWLELLHETIPQLSTVAVIANPDNPFNRDMVKELATAAPASGVKLQVIQVRTPDELDGAFQQIRGRVQAVLVLPDPLTLQNRRRITALAAKHRLPDMYPLLDFMDSGGLMAYGIDLAVMFRRASEYVDKILKGAKPGDLPIEQPTKFELVINLRTAKKLELTIPQSILVRADEVIR
jgi:putative ABC transport system substrate-binding protein